MGIHRKLSFMYVKCMINHILINQPCIPACIPTICKSFGAGLKFL